MTQAADPATALPSQPDQPTDPDEPTDPGSRTSPTLRREVARELGIFLAVQLALTTATTVVAVQQGADIAEIESSTPLAQTALYLSALWPMVAAFTARRVVHGRIGWSGWGLRRCGLRPLLLAWGVTLVTVLGGAILLPLTGVAAVDLSAGGPLPLLGLTVIVAPYVVLALGEELGWRGLVVTRLAAVAPPRTVVLVSGLAWSAFHWPLILLLGGTPDGVAPMAAVVMFSVALTAFAAVLASLQLRWGVWPVCVAHAVWNATLYQVVEPVLVADERTGWFSSETGLYLAVVSVVVTGLWWRRFPLRRTAAGSTSV